MGQLPFFVFSLLPSLTLLGLVRRGCSDVSNRALQIKKKARVSLSRRACVVRAQREDVPAFDVSRLFQPKEYLDLLLPVAKSHISESAKVGARVSETLRNTKGPAISVARILRSEWEVPPESASVMQDVCDVSCLRCLLEPRLRHVCRRCAKLRDTLVDVSNAAKMPAQLRMRTPASGEWPFPISSEGCLRSCAKPGCEKCERHLVMIVRGVAQIACRWLDLNSPEPVRLLRACRACRGPPRSKRASVKNAACGPARGPRRTMRPSDRPPVVSNVAEPRAEPSRVHPDRVVFLDADLVPSSRVCDSARKPLSPPRSVVARL